MDDDILPASAERIAREAGPAVLRIYNEEGLMCFRDLYIIKESGQKLVKEGYMLPTILPDGRKIYKRVETRTLTAEQAAREA